MTFRSVLTNPLIIGPLGGFLAVLLAYIDAKLRDVDRERDTYWKLGIVSALVISALVYLLCEELTKTDEFLDQAYETELKGSMMPVKHGGYEVSEPYQNDLKGPSENIQSMMSDLKPSSLTPEPPKMPKSIFPQVSMSTKRVKPKNSSKSSRKSYRNRKGHRSHKLHKLNRSSRHK